MDMKNKIEIYLMPFSVVMIFFGLSTPFMAFALSNYLRIKYYLNAVFKHHYGIEAKESVLEIEYLSGSD